MLSIKYIKAVPLWLKQFTNTLEIRIFFQNSILYLIGNASVILIVGLRLEVQILHVTAPCENETVPDL